MAIVNEIQINGTIPELNGMTMWRKTDITKKIFEPNYYFDNDNQLSLSSNIVVNYLQYYKNSDGEVVEKLTEHKYYVVGNRAATYKQQLVTEAELDEEGNVITPAVYETVVDVPAWLGANRWFLSVSRTPMTAPYGIMDGIEATLALLPKNIPNGYVLQSPL